MSREERAGLSGVDAGASAAARVPDTRDFEEAPFEFLTVGFFMLMKQNITIMNMSIHFVIDTNVFEKCRSNPVRIGDAPQGVTQA